MRLHIYDSPNGNFLGFTNRIIEAGGNEEITEFLETKRYGITEPVRGPTGGLVHAYAEVTPKIRDEDIAALGVISILHLGNPEELTIFDVRGVRPNLLTEHEIQAGKVTA